MLLEPGHWLNRALFFGLLAAFLTSIFGLYLISAEPPPSPSRNRIRKLKFHLTPVWRAVLWGVVLTLLAVVYTEQAIAFWNLLLLALVIFGGEMVLRTSSDSR
jgi:hypothetical protein